MTLSKDHLRLVTILMNWCEQREQASKFVVFVDDLDSSQGGLPPSIGGYRADLVWISLDSTYRFIGEAKTRNDIQNKHTRSQLLEYMQVLHNQGSGELVVAVPWGLENTMRSMIAGIQSRNGFSDTEWYVISDTPV